MVRRRGISLLNSRRSENKFRKAGEVAKKFVQNELEILSTHSSAESTITSFDSSRDSDYIQKLRHLHRKARGSRAIVSMTSVEYSSRDHNKSIMISGDSSFENELLKKKQKQKSFEAMSISAPTEEFTVIKFHKQSHKTSVKRAKLIARLKQLAADNKAKKQKNMERKVKEDQNKRKRRRRKKNRRKEEEDESRTKSRDVFEKIKVKLAMAQKPNRIQSSQCANND